MRIAMDMSSLMWTALLVGKDTEAIEVLHNDKKVMVNTAGYGYENIVNMMVSTLNRFDLAPKDLILVFEGKNSKRRRLTLDAAYKEGRGDRPNEAYREFQDLKEHLSRQWRHLGAIQVTQDGVEADDILAWLARETEEDLVIVSRDGDLAKLCGTNGYGAKVHTLIGERFDENPYGPFPCEHLTVYKALVGDSSDNIKGCPRFGDQSFIKFYGEFGDYGLEVLGKLLEENNRKALEEDAGNKYVDMILANWDQVLKSYRVARLRPEWVNTQSTPLDWKAGITLSDKGDQQFYDERVAHWYATKYLVTADKFESAVAWAAPFLANTPEIPLDIETSVPQESFDWLEGKRSKTAKKGSGVDVIASRLTGLSITFGKNLEKSLYFAVDHADTNNCSSEQVQALIEHLVSLGKKFIVQNAAGFEIPVLGLNWKPDAKPSERFIPGMIDTRIEANYFNENLPEFGLKYLSKLLLGYDQTTYGQVTTVNEGTPEEPVLVQKQVNELSGSHVLNYGCDDTITCGGLHNFFKLMLQLEHHYHVFLDVEPDAYYLGAEAFIQGVPMSMKRLQQLKAEDEEKHAKAWAVFREFLIASGWAGTVPPTYTPAITPKEIKHAYGIVCGLEVGDADDESAEAAEGEESSAPPADEAPKDPFLTTKLRKIDKLVALARECGQPLFAEMLIGCVRDDEGAAKFTEWVRSKFKAEPQWKMSPTQKAKVLYDILGLPKRLVNPPTDKMRAEGRTEGNPRTDALSVAYALKYDIVDRPEIKPILNALQEMQVVETRQGLYWKPYPKLVHWQTGLLHPQIRQSSTNTRRATGAEPNVQQMSKHEKVVGDLPKVREIIVPHKRNAVVVSMDFKSQELVIIADYSRDENMLACFVGDNLRDMHSMTGQQILIRMEKEFNDWSYEAFVEALGDEKHPHLVTLKKYRNLGKKTNFTTEYGAMAPKLAETLLVEVDEAQIYIDAKEAMFPGVRVWKNSVEAEAIEYGFVRTKMGAVRHLGELLNSPDKYEASKALRQSVNFKVQSSSAEQTKRACGAAWRAKLLDRFDCRFYFPVHDEVVWSCVVDDLFEFIPALHDCMVQPYADVSVPIKSSIAFGKSFGPKDQIEIGEEPTREAIQEGIDKWRKSLEAV